MPRVWRGELFGRDLISSESEHLAACARAVPVGVSLSLGFMVLVVLSMVLSPRGETAPAWLGAVAAGFALVNLVVVGAIIVLNVPKVLVPPERRGEEGLYFQGLQRRLRRD